MVQVVECLPSKCEARSTKPSTAKKKKVKKSEGKHSEHRPGWCVQRAWVPCIRSLEPHSSFLSRSGPLLHTPQFC
jgi:hypothetical protein